MSVTEPAFLQPLETTLEQPRVSTPGSIVTSNDTVVNFGSNITPSGAASVHGRILHAETDNTKQDKPSQLDHRPVFSKPKGNLELYENMFECWRKQEMRMEQSSKDLFQKLVLNSNKCKETDSKVNAQEKSIALLQAAIKSLHNDLNLADTLGRENSELKSKITTMVEEINSIKKRSEQNEMEYVRKLKEMQQIHETSIDSIKERLHENIMKQREKMEEIIKNKNIEIQELKAETETLKKQKESDVAMITVDYENKLAKLQRQKAVASMNQQQTSSNQEIFRRKLQHVKLEYDRETMTLKEQLRSAQAQLTTYQQRERQHIAVPQASKKMRKF